jgi:hypothetical protein
MFQITVVKRPIKLNRMSAEVLQVIMAIVKQIKYTKTKYIKEAEVK